MTYSSSSMLLFNEHGRSVPCVGLFPVTLGVRGKFRRNVLGRCVLTCLFEVREWMPTLLVCSQKGSQQTPGVPVIPKELHQVYPRRSASGSVREGTALPCVSQGDRGPATRE